MRKSYMRPSRQRPSDMALTIIEATGRFELLAKLSQTAPTAAIPRAFSVPIESERRLYFFV
jgi:hypothetical protein